MFSWQEDKSVGATKWNRGWSNCTLCGYVIGRVGLVNQILARAAEPGARRSHTHTHTSADERRYTQAHETLSQRPGSHPAANNEEEVWGCAFVCASKRHTLVANLHTLPITHTDSSRCLRFPFYCCSLWNTHRVTYHTCWHETQT